MRARRYEEVKKVIGAYTHSSVGGREVSQRQWPLYTGRDSDRLSCA